MVVKLQLLLTSLAIKFRMELWREWGGNLREKGSGLSEEEKADQDLYNCREFFENLTSVRC